MHEPHDMEHVDELIADLRARSPYDWEFVKKLVRQTGLARSTIMNLMEGKTKRPAITTVGVLNKALGYKLVRVPLDYVALPLKPSRKNVDYFADHLSIQ